MLALPDDSDNDEFELFLAFHYRFRNVYIACMRMQEYSINEIAKELCLSCQTIRKILKKKWVRNLIRNNLKLFIDPREQDFYHGKFIHY